MKQMDIWGIPTEPQLTLELYQPEEKIFQYWNDKLAQRYTVPTLEERMFTFRSLINNRKVIVDSNGVKRSPKVITDIQQKKGAFRKYELTAFLAFFLADLRNFRIYLDHLPEDIQLLWRLTFDRYYVSHTEFKQQTNKSWITESNRSFYDTSFTILPELAWFLCPKARAEGVDKYGYIQNDFYFFLPDWLRIRLSPLFYPKEACTPTELPELPNTPFLKTFNGEAAIHLEFPIVESMCQQGTLEFSKNKMAASVFKKTAQQVNMAEFFAGHDDSTVSHLRSSFVLHLYPKYKQLLHIENEPPEKAFKILFSKICHYPGIIIPALLPHVSGLHASIIVKSGGLTIVNRILSTFINLNSKNWVSVGKLIASVRLDDEVSYLQLFELNYFDKLEVNNKKRGSLIRLNSMYTEMTIPFIKAFFFLLAAFGLVEIAYADFNDNSLSYFCSLRYVRLTSLGAYVLGLDEKYVPSVSKDETAYFELDPQNLIIRSLIDSNPYESLLLDTAQPIGYHRYRVSAESFLKNCMNKKDVNNKIDFFRQYIHSDLPELWVNFFNSLQLRCHPLLSIPNSSYVIYQVEAGNKELQKLLSTDPVIRKYTVRAENYLLLIEVKNQKQVIDRLKSFGYLL